MANALRNIEAEVSEHAMNLEQVSQQMEDDTEALALDNQFKALKVADSFKHSMEDVDRRVQRQRETHEIQTAAQKVDAKIRNKIDFVGLAMDVGVKAATSYADVYQQNQRNNLAREGAMIEQETGDAMMKLNNMEPHKAAAELQKLRVDRIARIRKARESNVLPSSVLDSWESKINQAWETEFRGYLRSYTMQAERAIKNTTDQALESVYNIFERGGDTEKAQKLLQQKLRELRTMTVSSAMRTERGPESESKDAALLEKMEKALSEKAVTAIADNAIWRKNRPLAKKILANNSYQPNMTTETARRLRAFVTPTGGKKKPKYNDTIFKSVIRRTPENPNYRSLMDAARESQDPRNLMAVRKKMSYDMDWVNKMVSGDMADYSDEQALVFMSEAYIGEKGERWEPKKYGTIHTFQDTSEGRQEAVDNDPYGFAKQVARSAMEVGGAAGKWGEETLKKLNELTPDQRKQQFRQFVTAEEVESIGQNLSDILKMAPSDPSATNVFWGEVGDLKKQFGNDSALFAEQLKSFYEKKEDATPQEKNMALLLEQALKVDDKLLSDVDLKNASLAIGLDIDDKLKMFGVKDEDINANTLGIGAWVGTDEKLLQVYTMAQKYEAWKYLNRAGSKDPDRVLKDLDDFLEKRREFNQGRFAQPVEGWFFSNGGPGRGKGIGGTDIIVNRAAWEQIQAEIPDADANFSSFIKLSTDKEWVLEHFPISNADRIALQKEESRLGWMPVPSQKIGGEFVLMWEANDGSGRENVLTYKGRATPFRLSAYQFASNPRPFETQEQRKAKSAAKGWLGKKLEAAGDWLEDKGWKDDPASRQVVPLKTDEYIQKDIKMKRKQEIQKKEREEKKETTEDKKKELQKLKDKHKGLLF